MRSFTISRCVLASSFLFLVAATSRAQATQEVRYEYTPSQVAANFEHTLDDYQYLEPSGDLQRVVLNGASAEISYRRFYPIEIVGQASYSKGSPLGQTLLSITWWGGVDLRRGPAAGV